MINESMPSLAELVNMVVSKLCTSLLSKREGFLLE